MAESVETALCKCRQLAVFGAAPDDLVRAQLRTSTPRQLDTHSTDLLGVALHALCCEESWFGLSILPNSLPHAQMRLRCTRNTGLLL